MKSMKNQIISIYEKVSWKIIDLICEFSMSVGERSIGTCSMFGAYEPKIPVELLDQDN
ncbi:cyclic lactone autoinducer peptide [Clostridium butyricum]|uniref:cyclic lactone autoinducer peptide n=1 Tax=Clostridium butyricum TaxID=1492 RepID=UPI0013D08914|nr:cyclic lactone autoinducer peptide [Clostridium butyricum]MCQ2016692.1 cyclic lactone autoinducer peptide [Clostridium butyricum]MCQ2023650.1 cyclic lactone autoinducer peptide [Clostridium butyricum]MDU5724253.1 cyclic lactone autoinducer peptide [Clostridium butyricum]MDU5820426.1 cyclic lactone autoinducer peptide [Clostridium butyricum]NFB69652.1 cyclic lactone autoinducer peptide [Clostridium butyricum]